MKTEKRSEGKNPRKRSYSAVNPSRSPFKKEVKVKIYQGEINALKLNHWLQQLEVYFNVHHIVEEYWIPFSILKLKGLALK